MTESCIEGLPWLGFADLDVASICHTMWPSIEEVCEMSHIVIFFDALFDYFGREKWVSSRS